MKKLYGSLTIKPAYGAALPIPKDADLDKAEKAIGAKLPAAYRDYAKIFGLGEHGGYYRVYVPMGPKYKASDLALHTEQYRKDFAGRAKDAKDKAVFQAWIPFADTVGGDIFAFDTTAKPKTPGEWPVVVLIHERTKPEALSASFEEFMEDVVYGNGLDKVRKPKEKIPVIREFMPYGDKVRGL